MTICRRILLVTALTAFLGPAISVTTFAQDNKRLSTISSDKGEIVIKTFIVRKGVFMSDDVGDNAAFKDYCEQNNHKPHIIEFDGKFAGVIIKE
jgi:hypothetical protein